MPRASSRARASTRCDRASGTSRRRRLQRARARRSDVPGATETRDDDDARRPCVVYDVSRALTAYDDVWAWQRGFVDAALRQSTDRWRDVAILCAHPPTVTLGAGSVEAHVKFNLDAPPDGFAVRRCERGGEATYHGPGQLVLYPILNLGADGRARDLRAYTTALEEVALRAMIELGCDASKCHRIDGLTGAWCDGHKLAAVGVRARRWITYHGVALNVCPDLSHFAVVVPCGIDDRPVGSVAQILRGEEGVVSSAFAARVPETRAPMSTRERDELTRRAADAVVRAFADVFHVDVDRRSRAPTPREIDALDFA